MISHTAQSSRCGHVALNPLVGALHSPKRSSLIAGELGPKVQPKKLPADQTLGAWMDV